MCGRDGHGKVGICERRFVKGGDVEGPDVEAWDGEGPDVPMGGDMCNCGMWMWKVRMCKGQI